MTFKFIKEIGDISPEIDEYVRNALLKSTVPTWMTNETIKNSIKDKGIEFYSVYENNVLIGFFTYTLSLVGKTKFMNLFLLDGKKTLQWFPVMAVFLREIFDASGADEFTMIGRPGWKRLFPQLEVAGVIYKLAR